MTSRTRRRRELDDAERAEIRNGCFAAGLVVATITTWQFLDDFGIDLTLLSWLVAVVLGFASGLAAARVGYLLLVWVNERFDL